MDLAQILRELSKHRAWLVVGVLVAVAIGLATAFRPSLFPPKLEKKAVSLGAAKTVISVDSPRSSLLYSGQINDLDPLIARAKIFSRLMSTPPVLRLIAQEANLPVGAIATADGGSGSQPGADERASQIAKEDQGYRLAIQPGEEQPLITVFTQARTADDAIRLADAAAGGLAKYLGDQQDLQQISKSRRVEVRQLGRATGGTLNSGIDLVVAILAAAAGFVGFCLLILLVTSLRRNIKASNAEEERERDSSTWGAEPDEAWSPEAPDDLTLPDEAAPDGQASQGDATTPEDAATGKIRRTSLRP